MLIQEELVAIAVLQLWLHNEVDKLSVVGAGGVGDVGVVQLPIWGQPWRKGIVMLGRALQIGQPLAQGRLPLR